jgi:glutamyl-tRNA synthetase
LKIRIKTVCSRCRRIYHGSLEWLGIAPDETIGKNENLATAKAKEKICITICCCINQFGNAYYAFDTAKLWMKQEN